MEDASGGISCHADESRQRDPSLLFHEEIKERSSLAEFGHQRETADLASLLLSRNRTHKIDHVRVVSQFLLKFFSKQQDLNKETNKIIKINLNHLGII